MRGPLAHPPVPIARTRREEFHDVVLDAAERIASYVASELGTTLEARGLVLEDVAFAVEDVPPPAPPDMGTSEDDIPVVPLGRVDHAVGARPATVVVYRRPVDLRTDSDAERAELVHDIVVEQLADLLDVDPDDIDPGYED